MHVIYICLFCDQIIFEAIVSGDVGDIAIDEVIFARDNNCSLIPEFARSTYSAGKQREIYILKLTI